MATQLESNHEWQQPVCYAETAQVGHVQYSFYAAPEERSGSEHDITGWLDNIPTSPGVRLPPIPRHKTQLRLSSIQCFYNQHENKSWEGSIH